MNKSAKPVLATLFLFALSLAAAADAVAVAFTGPEANGYSWVIPAAGDYDLGDFGLPDDSVWSIVLKPGYSAEIFVEPGFGGGSFACDYAAVFPDELKNTASSIRIVPNGAEFSDTVARAWRNTLAAVEPFRPVLASSLRAKEFNAGLIENAHSIEALDVDPDAGALAWRDLPEGNRVGVAGNMLEIFAELGYGVSNWKAGDLAWRIGNFLAWLPGSTPWTAGCAAVGIDPGTDWTADMTEILVGVWSLYGIEGFERLDDDVRRHLAGLGFAGDGRAPGKGGILVLDLNRDGTYALAESAPSLPPNRTTGEYRAVGGKVRLLGDDGTVRYELSRNNWNGRLLLESAGVRFALEKHD